MNTNRTLKKLSISMGLILASVAYAFYQNSIPASSIIAEKNNGVENLPQAVIVQTPPPRPKQTTSTSTKTAPRKPTPMPVPTPTPVQTPMPVPTPKPVLKYADGVYTGNPADAYYGIIQVKATINNGALADVQFLRHPNDRGTSIRINNYAMPILRQEAIRAQNANVDIISGATDSSQAFV
ncbi:MAG TPA: FMN-binding protein, partial [Candidatus Paceibacterota bacterium]|nr:FMN-binding protein [Candidatus Paceibacterota bacterium]